MAAFEFSRSTSISAPPTVVHALINDFHRWEAWSPWEDVDQACVGCTPASTRG
ncbi:hypothetical protein ACOCJ4_03325 [Knoellia sp. CPCC 206435]|uniref:hypothetical protein n=1 Tax=Knoellia terrae TaxID=3404797 RepID=UPI003B42B402